MELLGIAALIAFLIWYGSARAKEARRKQAASFTYDAPDGFTSWIGNFTTSRLHYMFSMPDHDSGGLDFNRDYELRRDPEGSWSIRLTDESWAKALQRARKMAKTSLSPSAKEAGEQELAQLGDAPSWETLPSALLPLVESRYQTFAAEFDRRL